MLLLGFVLAEALCVLFHDEPRRTSRCVRQDGVGIRHSAVADPLFRTVDLVSNDASLLHNALRCRLQGWQIAARFRFGCTISEEQALIGDSREPEFFLFRSCADSNRIA